MSEAETNVLEPDRKTFRKSEPRKAQIFFIYLLAGPPIGALILIVAGGLVSILLSSVTHPLSGNYGMSIPEVVTYYFFATPMAMLFSYIFGGLQAAGTGLFLTFLSTEKGKFNYSAALLAPLPPSGIAFVVTGHTMAGFGVLLCILSVLSSLMLRFLFRKRFELTGSVQDDY